MPESPSSLPFLPPEIVRNPIRFAKALWPDVEFYAKQREVIVSVEENDETYVVAGHQLGKDFVAAYVVLRFFLLHHTCRVVTTSVKGDHLKVLWGEIGRFIDTCAVPLTAEKGGPLVVNHQALKKVVNGSICPISYCVGQVSKRGEGMAGHHADWTLFVADEASGVDDEAYRRADTWSGGGRQKRKLLFGNPYSCENFFRRGVEQGDLLATD